MTRADREILRRAVDASDAYRTSVEELEADRDELLRAAWWVIRDPFTVWTTRMEALCDLVNKIVEDHEGSRAARPAEPARFVNQHRPDCAWWTWDWQHSWDTTDCTCANTVQPVEPARAEGGEVEELVDKIRQYLEPGVAKAKESLYGHARINEPSKAISALDTLATRLREYETALKPFADYHPSRGWDDSWERKQPDRHVVMRNIVGEAVTIGDLRRARAAIGIEEAQE